MAEWTTEKEFDRPSTAQVPPKYRPSTAQVEKLLAVMNDDYIDVSEMMKLCSIVRRKCMIVISLLHWQMAVLNGNIQNIQTIQNRCTD